MSYADKKQASKNQNRWISEKYDRINLTVPKGQKDVIQAYAKWRGMSVNGLIGWLIEKELNEDPNLLEGIMTQLERERQESEWLLFEEQNRSE